MIFPPRAIRDVTEGMNDIMGVELRDFAKFYESLPEGWKAEMKYSF
jgi:hypothetical protein